MYYSWLAVCNCCSLAVCIVVGWPCVLLLIDRVYCCCLAVRIVVGCVCIIVVFWPCVSLLVGLAYLLLFGRVKLFLFGPV